jgi:hypothetical protein
VLHEFLEECRPKVKKDIRKTWLSTELCRILSQLFFTKRAPTNAQKGKELWRDRKKHKPYDSCPMLPPMPANIAEEVANFNKDVQNIYTNYIWSQCARTKFSAELGDFKLPYTGTTALEKFPNGMFFDKNGGFANFWVKRVNKFKARSLFSAMKGNVGDNFLDHKDAIENTRLGIAKVDMNSIPVIQTENVNSYILDFLIHGDLKLLMTDNGINNTEAYQLIINGFLENVKMLKHALEKITSGSTKEAPDVVLEALIELITELEAQKKRN